MISNYTPGRKAALSEELKSQICSGDETLRKNAGLAASDYFRVELRQNGIFRQVVPTKAVTKENFDVVEDTDFPTMYVEIAPQSAGAYQVPFETNPKNNVIHARRARVDFNRIMTYKYEIDKIRLEMWKMDLLDILYDLMLKDIMDVEDSGWTSVNTAIVGELNTVNDELGCCRNIELGPMDRDSIAEAKKGIMVTEGRLQPAKFLMNDLTYVDFSKINRNEIGGDLAQDMFINGTKLTKVNGIDILITNKRNLVATNDIWMFADPIYYGGFYTYKDVSMVVGEKDDIWLTFFAHETIGAIVANMAGVALGHFTGTAHDWITGA